MARRSLTRRRTASDNMRMAQMIVDVNRLIIATRMVMPSLFCKSVYVSISSFDTVTMQGIFSFLDTQVALYNNLLERATTTSLWDAMSSYINERASGLELVLSVLPLGPLSMQ